MYIILRRKLVDRLLQNESATERKEICSVEYISLRPLALHNGIVRAEVMPALANVNRIDFEFFIFA